MLFNPRLCSESSIIGHRVHLHRSICDDIIRPCSEALFNVQSVIYIGCYAIHGGLESHSKAIHFRKAVLPSGFRFQPCELLLAFTDSSWGL